MKSALSPLKKNKRRVFLVDDHPLLRDGLTRLINQEHDLAVCGEAHTAHEALKIIPGLKPDVIIVDITLPGSSNGMDLIKNMRLRSFKSSILVLSMHDEALYAERVLRAGAKGYIMKQEASKEVLKALHRVLSGEIYLSKTMGAKMLHRIADNRPDTHMEAPTGGLSDRELQVFELIGQGRGTRDIAIELSISVKTVESYRAHIKTKMDLKDAHELTQHAVHWVERNHLN